MPEHQAGPGPVPGHGAGPEEDAGGPQTADAARYNMTHVYCIIEWWSPQPFLCDRMRPLIITQDERQQTAQLKSRKLKGSKKPKLFFYGLK